MIATQLLTYAMHLVNSSAHDNVKQIIQSFYSSSEISIAKGALCENCGDVLGKMPEQKFTDKRHGPVAHNYDIFDVLKTLDALDILPNVVSCNLNRLPNRQPEELNILIMVQKTAALEKSSVQQVWEGTGSA